MKKIILVLSLAISLFASVGSELENSILKIITNGQNKYTQYGGMPIGIVNESDAKIIAKYISNDFKGKGAKKYINSICTGCHNKDGNGIPYVAPSLKLYVSLFKEYKIVKQENTIKLYQDFINKYPNAPQKKQAIENIYKSTKQQNNISGYEWFVSKYPNALQIKDAIENIHKLAYDKAKEINTISAYNTFIISYPTALQVKEANDKTYKLEEKKYTDLGMMGFFGKEAKLEKKARKLLIKAKQIERKSKDYSGDAKAGYIIVANRMYQLLQDKFDESDATLRYLESQEFKDFVDTFKRVMNNISYKLSNIERYSSEILSTSKQGFEDAKADRQMSRYKSEQQHQWEKRMHLRDKGYN